MRHRTRLLLASLATAIAIGAARTEAQNCGSGVVGSNPAYGPSSRFTYVDSYLGEVYPGYYEVIWFIATGPEGGPYLQEISGGGLRVETPSWSPDGTHIAYSDQFRIRVAEVPNHAAYGSELTDGVDTNPTWSPDGSTIAFARLTNGSVCTVPAIGGAVTTLWPGSAPAWSPTSDLIAYQLEGDIWLGDLSMGPVRRLTDGSLPAWSPDGNWIAYSRTMNGNVDIWAIAVTNGTPVQLTTDPSVDTDPTWSSDGATIAYSQGSNAECIQFLTHVPDTTVDAAQLPMVAQLIAAPNPFRSTVHLAVTQDDRQTSRIDLLDVSGRRIRSWETQGAGVVMWNGTTDRGTRVPAGVYFARLSTGGRQVIRRLLFVP